MIDYLHHLYGIPKLFLGVLWPILVVLSLLYRLATYLRNQYYNFKSPWRSKCKTISLGNLSSGGTGKTPVGLALIEYYKNQGLRVAVVLRGYASKDGLSDEAQLYAQFLGNEAIFVGSDRQKSLEAVDAAAYDLAILDDAFQHRRVHRDVNIVLMDVTKPAWSDRILPWGLLREGCGALKRCDFLWLTRTEQLEGSELLKMRQKLSREISPDKIFNATTQFLGIALLGHSNLSSAPEAYFLVTGIGHPENFKTSVSQSGMKVLGQKYFPDHHHFTEAEQRECIRLAQQVGAKGVLLTTKDAVKWTINDRVYVFHISTKISPEALTSIDDLLLKKRGDVV